LRVGDALHRRSTITSVQPKSGRAGAMVFVTVQHEIHGPLGLAISEDQHIVYRGAGPRPMAKGVESAGRPASTSPDETLLMAPTWQREVIPSSSLLFRYSALTFNAHRIHYDRPYACEVEGYPGLVVHGPLQATLLLDLVARELPQRQVKSFEFSARSPLFDGQPFIVCGSPVNETRADLWTEDHRGAQAMRADMHWG
jgi:3-methylfumaryl-CoA hydratase